MFAIVRTGGKQYRVAAGDKIAVDKMAGEAGDTVSLGEALFASDGGEVKSGLTVSAEIVAQAKADKIIVFKKKRRHNYRRKAGHRQQHTILKIVSVGDDKPAKKAKAEAAPAKAVPTVEAMPVSSNAEAPVIAPNPAPSAVGDAPKPAAPKKDAAPKAAKASAKVAGEAAPGVVEAAPATEAKPVKAAKPKASAPEAGDVDQPKTEAKKASVKKRAE